MSRSANPLDRFLGAEAWRPEGPRCDRTVPLGWAPGPVDAWDVTVARKRLEELRRRWQAGERGEELVREGRELAAMVREAERISP